jgi:peptidoglycan/LPS O-acetylase OafA/YrhL
LFFADKAPGGEWLGSHVPLSVVLVLTMQQAWVPKAALAWNGVCWAVSAEIFFYVVFPWLLARMVRMREVQLWFLAGFGWLVALAAAKLYCLKMPDGIPIISDVMRPDGLFWMQLLKFNPLVRLPEFVAGMATGIVFLRMGNRLPRAERLVMSGVGLLALILMLGERIPYPIMHTGLTLPAFLLIILGLAQRPVWASFLDGRFYQLLGESSYSLYLLHMMFIGIALFAGRDLRSIEAGPDHGWLRLLMGSIVATGVGIAVFRWIEEPLRKRLTKR